MKLEMERGLEKILDVTPEPHSVISGEVLPPSDQSEDDFELSRNSLRNLISTGEQALSELVHIASASEHPRAFEVVSSLIKTIGDTSKALADLHKTRKEISRSDAPASNVTNNLVLTTNDVLRLLRGNDG